MIRSIAVAAALTCLAACSARRSPDDRKSKLFTQSWNSGLSREEPAFQSQAIDQNTYAIRQSINSTFEAPFLYLVFGRDRALLIDTGVEGAPLRAEIDRLIDSWLAASGRKAIPLVVMHSHGHSDHVGGDAGFADRADTAVVGHSVTDIAGFFGIEAWPAQTAPFDLGDRVVDIVPTPGHHPSHVMVFDRATHILFSGDAIYPGRLYFQCSRAQEYRVSIERLAAFAATHDVRWLLGAHIEMRSAPEQVYESEDRVRHDEHLLELRPTVLREVQRALAKMGEQVRVEAHDDFILFPHPADPRGKNPPDWCAAEAAS
jgi:glyoxylase-like metal-dependent hydrolase (beta-lactamase superfamily II)